MIFKDDKLLLADIFNKVDMNNHEEFHAALTAVEMELGLYQERFRQTFRYCIGCKGFAKLAETYEDECYMPSNENGDYMKRHVLKCCNCHAVIKFLD